MESVYRPKPKTKVPDLGPVIPTSSNAAEHNQSSSQEVIKADERIKNPIVCITIEDDDDELQPVPAPLRSRDVIRKTAKPVLSSSAPEVITLHSDSEPEEDPKIDFFVKIFGEQTRPPLPLTFKQNMLTSHRSKKPIGVSEPASKRQRIDASSCGLLPLTGSDCSVSLSTTSVNSVETSHLVMNLPPLDSALHVQSPQSTTNTATKPKDTSDPPSPSAVAWLFDILDFETIQLIKNDQPTVTKATFLSTESKPEESEIRLTNELSTEAITIVDDLSHNLVFEKESTKESYSSIGDLPYPRIAKHPTSASSSVSPVKTLIKNSDNVPLASPSCFQVQSKTSNTEVSDKLNVITASGESQLLPPVYESVPLSYVQQSKDALACETSVTHLLKDLTFKTSERLNSLTKDTSSTTFDFSFSRDKSAVEAIRRFNAYKQTSSYDDEIYTEIKASMDSILRHFPPNDDSTPSTSLPLKNDIVDEATLAAKVNTPKFAKKLIALQESHQKPIDISDEKNEPFSTFFPDRGSTSSTDPVSAYPIFGDVDTRQLGIYGIYPPPSDVFCDLSTETFNNTFLSQKYENLLKHYAATNISELFSLPTFALPPYKRFKQHEIEAFNKFRVDNIAVYERLLGLLNPNCSTPYMYIIFSSGGRVNKLVMSKFSKAPRSCKICNKVLTMGHLFSKSHFKNYYLAGGKDAPPYVIDIIKTYRYY